MPDLIYAMIALLIVILIVTLVTLVRNKNVKQNLRLPGGVEWGMEVMDDKGRSSTSMRQRSKMARTGEPEGGVNFGRNNTIKGHVGHIAGHNIINRDSVTVDKNRTLEITSVKFGEENVFSGSIGDIAGHDIIKDQ